MKPSTYLSLLACVLLCLNSYGQNKKVTKNGQVTIEASVPNYEEIKAKNENTSCVLNTKNGEIEALVLVKQFHFKVPLMEEHFNTNFIESDRYPKSTFKGIIENFDIKQLGSSNKTYKITGKLKMHGVAKTISVPASIRKINEDIDIVASFSIKIEDFNIQTPEILTQKIARQTNINLHFLLK